jgi:hypothetical protein
LKEKKGLGVKGTTFEPLGPKLAARAAELGYTKRGKLGRDPDAVSTDSDEDAEISDSPNSSDNHNIVKEGADFIPLNIGKKKVEDSGEDKENKATANGVEPNPYFVVDTQPTPVILNGNGTEKKSKKREGGEGKKAKKAKKEKIAVPETASSSQLPEPDNPEVDFTEIEAKLQAEIEARSKAQEAQVVGSTEEKKSKKKRKRSSDDAEGIVEKKAKKEKSKKPKVEETPADETAEAAVEEKVSKHSGKKRKHDDTASGEDVTSVAVEKRTKKEKKEKPEKQGKRADGVDDGKKKKWKHKVGSDSE